MMQPDRMLAYRLLLKRGEWDVDAFFAAITPSQWTEVKVALAIIQSYDDWAESVKWGNKKPWEPPTFVPERAGKRQRRRLSGGVY